MYESRRQKPITQHHFARRMVMHALASAGLITGSLLLGMIGYRHFEGFAWRDAFLNSAMLLGGMGPMDPLRTGGGKLFAGLYALYAGLVFLIAIGLIVAPAFHRMMHLFHWDERAN